MSSKKRKPRKSKDVASKRVKPGRPKLKVHERERTPYRFKSALEYAENMGFDPEVTHFP